MSNAWIIGITSAVMVVVVLTLYWSGYERD